MYRLDFRNPIENSPEYRSSVLTMLPYLRSLDFAKGKVKYVCASISIKKMVDFSYLVTDRERIKPANDRMRKKRKKKHSL